MFTVLPEARRLAYLDVMGVDSYFPKLQLPGAKPSVLRETLPDFDAIAPERAAVDPRQQSAVPAQGGAQQGGGPVQTTGHEALRALMPEIEGIERPAAKKPAAVAAAPAVAKTDIVRFNLRFFQVPGLAMIVDSSPDSAPESPIQRLAANLLLALSDLNANWDGAIKANLQQHLFRWPVVGNVQVEQGEVAAKEAVTASVTANQERHNIPLVLLMGEQAVQYAGGEYSEAKVLTADSLSDYLINPLTKRELWQKLLANQ